MTKIEELKAAFEAATPGEWESQGFAISNIQTERIRGGVLANITGHGMTQEYAEKTATFIALAHNLMPQLLEAVELLDWVTRCATADVAGLEDGE